MTPKQRLAAARDIIEKLMDDSGLTQADIARELQVTERTVQRWWSGRVAPSRRHFIEILGLQQDDNEKEG
jgi:DNA-binding transcriptional regulator YiaG